MLGLIKEVCVPRGGSRVPYTISGLAAEGSQERWTLQDSGRQTDFPATQFPIPSSYLNAQMHHGNMLSLVFLGRTTFHSLDCWLSTGGLLVAGRAGCTDHGHREGLISRLLTLEA